MDRILIVDDDKDLLEVVKTLLDRKGFEVAIHSDIENLTDIVRGFKPQLVLLDVFLNGVDGLEVCRRLKLSPYFRNIPVVIFSSYPRIGETAIYEFGADDFIAKPFEINELVRKIHNVLSKKHESV
jgi:DNA-binding response OmpR family regulator